MKYLTNYLPQNGIVSSMKFYKCASVDGVNKTWSGYELLLQNGKYTVSDTLTEGLTYSSIQPAVEKVYTADALVQIALYYSGIPADGLMFYAPFNNVSYTSETGQPLVFSGVQATTRDGIPCVYFENKSSYIAVNDMFDPGTGDFTISLWLNYDRASAGWCVFLISGFNTASTRMSLLDNGQLETVIWGSGQINSNQLLDSNKWTHVVFMRKDGVMQHYINGVKDSVTQSNTSSANLNDNFMFGSPDFGGYTGYMACARVYNRGLSEGEVQALFTEITPV